MKFSKLIVGIVLFFGAIAFADAQTVSGTVVDGSGNPIPDATVKVNGSSETTLTDFDGNFTLDVPAGKGSLEVTTPSGEETIAYKVADGETQNLGAVEVKGKSSLSELVLIGKGVIDVEEDRKTPVAVNTIFKEEIQEKAQGNVEFPEVLKNTPNVYVDNGGGGFGDAQMFVRGFDQSNTAFLLNGQPINGMEDGKMYWSNWSGMTEIANAVQIQRGLGSSKLAISSVGGTVNIITKATEKKKGGYVQGVVGNDSYIKGAVGYNTGLSESGWGFSIALSQWQAHRKWARGTFGEGQNYFLSVGKVLGDHNFNFLITGAPQVHGQRWSQSASTLARDPKFNQHWGYMPGGQSGYLFNNSEIESERTNFYHKPIINLNWDWQIDETKSLSTVVYGSFGRGGGTGPRGGGHNNASDGGINYASTIAENELINGSILPGDDGLLGTADDVPVELGNNWGTWFGPDGIEDTDDDVTGNGFLPGDDGVYGTADDRKLDSYIRRSSMNNHQWFGLVSNFNMEINENLSFNVGVDGRMYKGDHFRQIANLYGLDGWANDRTDGVIVISEYEINPWKTLFDFADEGDRIAYDNSEWINYLGGFGQIEYATDVFSVYFQGAVSTQSYEREDRFEEDDLGNQVTKKSDKESEIGYNVKAGGAYFINENNSLYANAGFYSRQPYLDNKFTSTLVFNPNAENEEITGFEAGYKYQDRGLNVNVNLYHTTWENRTITGFLQDDDDIRVVDEGVGQRHMGVEVDFNAKVSSKFDARAYFAYGDWKYTEVGTSTQYAADNTIISQKEGEKLDDVFINRAPQTSFGAGLVYKIVKGLSIDADMNWYGRLYQREINFIEFEAVPRENAGTLPSYVLLDAGLTYIFKFGKQSVKFRGNVYNLLDDQYFIQSDAFGYLNNNGRTWNASITLNF